MVGKRAREQRADEKAEQGAETARAKKARMEDKAVHERLATRSLVAAEAAEEEGWRLRARGLAPLSPAKMRHRAAAARVRTPLLIPRDFWAVVSREVASEAKRVLSPSVGAVSVRGRGSAAGRDVESVDNA